MLLSVNVANEDVFPAKKKQARNPWYKIASDKIDSDSYRFQLSNKCRYTGREGENDRIRKEDKQNTSRRNEIPWRIRRVRWFCFKY